MTALALSPSPPPPPPSAPPPPSKAELRRGVAEARGRLGAAEIAAAAAQVADAALALPVWNQVRVVATYVAMSGRGELPVAPLESVLAARGVTVVWPRVAGGRGLPLAFHRAQVDRLEAGPFGLRQPVADSATEVPLGDIDVLIVPGLAFTREGARLGWGGGYYDATLAAAPAHTLRVGVGYDFQVVPFVPESAGDERVDVIVSEAGARMTGARRLETPWRAR
jgi:5-formyltetrahydrofolate cyclo-ligase